ncbi:methylaspartate mutase accessory protein GlmL [Zhaonella formicivorans]|uniref:methylaspartate mutase accessory protein GlmL n=1 Tax=Zhaonella formicivorans TaxID=2528593 RepID=UPI0010DC0302|nr:methylaspartate mutase accessory protein GlmL [Zhaonella formicivorans]
MELALLVDFGSTYTKVTVADLEAEEIKATSLAPTSVDTNIMLGLEKALANVRAVLGCDPPFKHKVACSSAAGGLKMVAVGLVKDLTVEAAKRAALGAGARVLDVFAHQLTMEEIKRINFLNPDIILLAGGTDGGNKEVLLHNAGMLCHLIKRIPVVVAGNKVVAAQAAAVLNEHGFETAVVANVMPELNKLNIEPARRKIREIFLQKIIEAKGLKQAEAFIDGILMPTPAAVLNAAHLLSKGAAGESGWGDLLVIDPGGATTDVHSIGEGAPSKSGITWKGLPEPEAKRTVEGDLGMRYSAKGLLEMGRERLKHLEADRLSALEAYVESLSSCPGYLAKNLTEAQFETILGELAVEVAVERHAGFLEVVYTPFGSSYLQYGKDLTEFKHVIGTGGVLVHHFHPAEVLKKALFNPATPQILKPHSPELWLDKRYIMAAMGLLAEIDAVKALRIMKKYMVYLGRYNFGTEK